MNSSNNKRKRVVLTLENKLEVIKYREEGVPIDQIASRFNIGGSTVSEIFKRRAEIELAVSNNRKAGKVRKTMKESKKPEVENLLYDWFLGEREIGSNPSQLEIIEKAKQIHTELSAETDDVGEWNPSKGWVVRFKERYGIKSDASIMESNTRDFQVEISEPKLTPSQSALEAAECLLEFISNRDFVLKDVITVRMIRDRIASEQEFQLSDY